MERVFKFKVQKVSEYGKKFTVEYTLRVRFSPKSGRMRIFADTPISIDPVSPRDLVLVPLIPDEAGRFIRQEKEEDDL